jgi:hypothetical protein
MVQEDEKPYEGRFFLILDFQGNLYFCLDGTAKVGDVS